MLSIKDFKKATGVHITTEHTGKMSGMWSLSTPCSCNAQCKKNAQVKGSICSKCYSMKQLARYKNQRTALEHNFDVLTSRVLTQEEMPAINNLYFRFEAFGDLANTTQLINYFNIASANPEVHFALWTKNYFIVEDVINQGYSKPANMNIIVSSLFINQEYNIKNFKYADKVFSVFDKEHAQAVGINCGARDCASCRKCYTKNDVVYIKELLK